MDIAPIPGNLVKVNQLLPADNGGLKFTLVSREYYSEAIKITLLAKECPHSELYMISFGYCTRTSVQSKQGTTIVRKSFISEPGTYDFCLTWFNKKLFMTDMNKINSSFKLFDIIEDNIIGFVKFDKPDTIDITVENDIAPLRPLTYKHIEGGQLHWVAYNASSNQLPRDAFIGGYEDGETIYIACAKHNRSQCLGKYVPSKGCAFVPWGHEEHRKEEFKILCGYNAMWMKCKENYIPENAFIAGTSEVDNEYLYIGRAMIGPDLIVGKVHMLYKTCYLPYKGAEHEKHTYEILVRADVEAHALTKNGNCFFNPMKASQPCI